MLDMRSRSQFAILFSGIAAMLLIALVVRTITG
jgi:hypothetical protein